MTRKKIIDEYTHETNLSRQRKYQLRHVRDGLCAECNRPQDPTSASLCAFHLEKRHRKRGSKPWISSRKGRPPKKVRHK